MKNLLVIIAFFSIVGCTNVKYSHPQQESVSKSKIFNLSYDNTWNRAVDWFADHNITIDKIEKNSGLITAKYSIKIEDKYLDCGQFKSSRTLGDPILERYGMLNMTVRKKSKEKTKVNANFFGEYSYTARDAWDGHLIKYSGTCFSTGKLEKSIFKYISQ